MQVNSVSRRGFTLLETLAALIIFTLLMVALSMALSTAMRARVSLQVHQEDGATVRAVFGILARDLAAASVSKTSTSSLFLGGASASSGTGSGLLMLSTLSHRIETDMKASGTISASTSGQQSPEWDGALVRYVLDRQKGELHRIVVTVPNAQALLRGSAPTDTTLIANHISALTLRFYDGGQQTWRSDWNYTGSASTSGSSSSASGGGSMQTDTSLPRAMDITLILRRSDGTQMTYSTHLPITAVSPLDFVPAASNPGAGSTGAGSGGTGGPAAGTGGGSSGQTGNSSGGG